MKMSFAVFALFLAGCASAAHKDDQVKVIYTALNTVSDRGPYTINDLTSLSHQEVLLDGKMAASLTADLERTRIGKSTLDERNQLEGSVYLAVFFGGNAKRARYISDGCHVLDLETGNLHRLDDSTAVDALGVPFAIYEERLCKEPGLGITLSPRGI